MTIDLASIMPAENPHIRRLLDARRDLADHGIYTACEGDPSTFTSDKQAVLDYAVTLCDGCPVFALCDAAGKLEASGVWGGKVRDRRKRSDDHCRNGHPRTDGNLREDGRCRTCLRNSVKRQMAKERADRAAAYRKGIQPIIDALIAHPEHGDRRIANQLPQFGHRMVRKIRRELIAEGRIPDLDYRITPAGHRVAANTTRTEAKAAA